MSEKNRKMIYDRDMKEGREDKIPDDLKAEFSGKKIDEKKAEAAAKETAEKSIKKDMTKVRR